MKTFNMTALRNRLVFWRGAQLARHRSPSQQPPLHIRTELFTCHAGGLLNFRATLRWHRAPPRYPLTHRWRRDAKQSREAADSTYGGTGFYDWLLFHDRESKALPNVRQEALPNLLLNESN